jgi:hypothetical protein
MERIFGGLIEFEDTEEFDRFVLNIDEESALTIIEKALEFCNQNRMFNLMEANTLYKCLTKLKENENQIKRNHLHNDDSDGDISSEIRS